MKRWILVVTCVCGLSRALAEKSANVQAQGVLRFNGCMEQMAGLSLAADREGAVELYMALIPPRMEISDTQFWRKNLMYFTKFIVDKEIESMELVSVERLSTQTYIYRYLLHGSDGPLLFTAKAYQYKGQWRSCGFSFRSDIDDILVELKASTRLREPMALSIPELEKKTPKKVINLLPHVEVPAEEPPTASDRKSALDARVMPASLD